MIAPHTPNGSRSTNSQDCIGKPYGSTDSV